jgi:hypothetical protein
MKLTVGRIVHYWPRTEAHEPPRGPLAAMVLEVSETRGNEEQTLILRVFDPRGAVVDATVRARRVPEVAAAPQHRMGCWDWPTITVQA